MLCEICRADLAICDTKGINSFEDKLHVCHICSYFVRWARLSHLADNLQLPFPNFKSWYFDKTGLQLFTSRYDMVVNV